MRVGELEELLARLPDDMLVCVCSGRTLCHVEEVVKKGRRRWRSYWPNEHLADGSVLEPMLRLEGGPLWYEPEPPFQFAGRWPRPKPPPELGRQPRTPRRRDLP